MKFETPMKAEVSLMIQLIIAEGFQLLRLDL